MRAGKLDNPPHVQVYHKMMSWEAHLSEGGGGLCLSLITCEIRLYLTAQSLGRGGEAGALMDKQMSTVQNASLTLISRSFFPPCHSPGAYAQLLSCQEERAAAKYEGPQPSSCTQQHVGVEERVFVYLFLHGNSQTQSNTDINEMHEIFPNFLTQKCY